MRACSVDFGSSDLHSFGNHHRPSIVHCPYFILTRRFAHLQIAGDPPTNTTSPSTSGINTRTATVGLHINPTNAFPSPTFSSYSSLYTSLISSTLSSSPYAIVTLENSHVPSLDLLQSILDGLINVQGYIALSTPSFWTG